LTAAGRRREAGFSLLEALLATTVLATGVLVVSQGFSLGTRAAALGRQYTQAALLAQSELTNLMLAQNLGTVEPQGEFTDSPLAGARWSFVDEETGTPGLVRLTVTVTWGGPWGERQLSLSALRPEMTELPQTAGGSSATPASSTGSSQTGGGQ
jgi:type II secretory pathway pseudopilin PulG